MPEEDPPRSNPAKVPPPPPMTIPPHQAEFTENVVKIVVEVLRTVGVLGTVGVSDPPKEDLSSVGLKNLKDAIGKVKFDPDPIAFDVDHGGDRMPSREVRDRGDRPERTVKEIMEGMIKPEPKAGESSPKPSPTRDPSVNTGPGKPPDERPDGPDGPPIDFIRLMELIRKEGIQIRF